MERYEAYKDSGIEWIGEIPEHWEVKRLKYIGDSIIGITYNPKDVVQEGGTLVLRSSNIQNGKLSLNDTVYINKDIPEKLKTKVGDILICSRNGSRRLIGKNITIDEKTEGETFGAFMTVFRTEKYNFISNYFNSQVFTGQSGLFLTSTINQLTVNTLNNFYTALPPKEEREKISKYLNEKTKEIDLLIEKKQELLKLYKSEKSTLIREVITKGLNPNVKFKETGIDWLGEIPEHWNIKSLRYLCKITTGNKDTENRVEGAKYPFFVRSQKIERIPTYSFDGEAILTAGDGVGVCKVWHYINDKFDFHQRVYMMYDFNEVIGEFLFHFMKENFIYDVLKKSAKSTVDSLRRPMFLEFNVAYPKSTKEQEEIIKYIRSEESRINKKIKRTKKLAQLLKEYKKTLISNVVTGKFKVT